jgi:hypothetical protein
LFGNSMACRQIPVDPKTGIRSRKTGILDQKIPSLASWAGPETTVCADWTGTGSSCSGAHHQRGYRLSVGAILYGPTALRAQRIRALGMYCSSDARGDEVISKKCPLRGSDREIEIIELSEGRLH